ncbi:MAG: S26 family signal peptidase, partial [Asticcacaulis sp.]
MTTPDDKMANSDIEGAASATAGLARPATTEAAELSSEAEAADGRSPAQVAMDEFKEIGAVVGVAVVLVLLLRTLLFQPFTIPSASMEPNLYQGDYIIVSKWNYGISKYSLPLALPVIKG